MLRRERARQFQWTAIVRREHSVRSLSAYEADVDAADNLGRSLGSGRHTEHEAWPLNLQDDVTYDSLVLLLVTLGSCGQQLLVLTGPRTGVVKSFHRILVVIYRAELRFANCLDTTREINSYMLSTR